VPAAVLRERREARVDEVGLPDVPPAGSLLLADLPGFVVVQEHVCEVHVVVDVVNSLIY
jgi:hypothetical protein